MRPLILVAGGAGYIGSHTVLTLQEQGFAVVVLDDLSTGHRDAVGAVPLLRVDLLDRAALNAAFAAHRFDAVVHFAARAYVGESVQNPALYYRNNVVGTLNLLEEMEGAGVKRLVFSSTCATYGQPSEIPILESCPQVPLSPYGHTKLACEFAMRDFAAGHGLATVALRYFNAAGADPEGRVGEDHRPEAHLIPLALGAAAGTREPLAIFGNDYPTPDGTCIRDYVHVTDLADAHVLALRSMLDGATGFRAFNLGNERGTSVAEIVRLCGKVTGRPVPHRMAPRRAGDPPLLVGSSTAIVRELGWRPRYSDPETIVATAWAWHRNHPHGYSD